MMKLLKALPAGQAMVEYLFVFGLLAYITITAVRMLGKFMGESMGNLAQVISIHLTVGVCGQRGDASKNNCFFREYQNGREN